jgi:LacI family transcriptional regulator
VQLVAQLNGTVTDGIIVVTPNAATYRTASPLVAIDPYQATTEFPAVIATNYQGVLEAMTYLVSLGHRRIGFIAGRPDLESAKRRLEGYHAGLAQAGITADPALIVTGDYTRAMGAECAEQLLSLTTPPTAIMASSDETAFGVYDAAAARGVRIPDDLSVIGFDNTLESISVNPPLTTVDQFIEKMGVLAAQSCSNSSRGSPARVSSIKSRRGWSCANRAAPSILVCSCVQFSPSKKESRMRRRTWIILLGLLVVASLMLSACARRA